LKLIFAFRVRPAVFEPKYVPGRQFENLSFAGGKDSCMRRLTMVREVGRASVYLVVPPRRGDGFATISRCAVARGVGRALVFATGILIGKS